MLNDFAVYCRLVNRTVTIVADLDWDSDESAELTSKNLHTILECLEHSGGRCSLRECILVDGQTGELPFDCAPIKKMYQIE